ncbi:DNaseII [Bugula neritina]|uniref:DNaseII n=1 Tax=Bugula neritina TaxID=10212 RepID=A0A7J7JJI1_BUGNE|nr:DNaseII [Bugula neritina]
MTASVYNIGLQLTYNQPWVYDYQISPQLGDKYPTMLNVITGVQHSHDSNVELIHSSVQQTVFIVFAKSPSFNQDLYSAMVAPSLQCNLLTETWQNGPKSGNLPSACNQTSRLVFLLLVI